MKNQAPLSDSGLERYRLRNLVRLHLLMGRGRAHAEMAYLLAGLAEVCQLLPTEDGDSQPTSVTVIGLAAVGLLGALLLMGPVLGSLQSVLQSLGRLPGWAWPSAAVAAVLLWLRRKGVRALAGSPVEDGENE